MSYSNPIESKEFRQQHGYGPYVMDLYCPTLHWCIEIDGEVHDTIEQKEKDNDRSAFLEQHGIIVTRIRNEDIEEDTNQIIELLRQEALKIAEKRKIKLPLTREERFKKTTIQQKDAIEL